MAVRATVSRFPMDADAREGSGLLWGVTVTPFAAADEEGQSPAYGSNGDQLPRCENCWAYFNTYCELEQWTWSCSLCGNLNGLTSDAIERYSRPQSCAEMMSSFVDLELPPRNSHFFSHSFALSQGFEFNRFGFQFLQKTRLMMLHCKLVQSMSLRLTCPVRFLAFCITSQLIHVLIMMHGLEF